MSNSDKTLELTAEQEQALDAHGGVVQGQSFVLMRTDMVLRFFGYHASDELARELKPAFDQADRGELEDWDVEEFLARMHRMHTPKSER
jgi:Ca2+-binding EF-hand superfamily protein